MTRMGNESVVRACPGDPGWRTKSADNKREDTRRSSLPRAYDPGPADDEEKRMTADVLSIRLVFPVLADTNG